MDRTDESYNLEKGISATLGFDFEINEKDKDFQFSIGQIISDKKIKVWDHSSLDEKVSDLVDHGF